MHLPGWHRRLKAVRENPRPAEGVAAWYEKKETALGKKREAGHARRSPRDSENIQDWSPEGTSCRNKES